MISSNASPVLMMNPINSAWELLEGYKCQPHTPPMFVFTPDSPNKPHCLLKPMIKILRHLRLIF